MEDLLKEIKVLIVNTLELEDIEPSSIGDDEALFGGGSVGGGSVGEGLGLDSIDALELGIALQKNYGVEIDEEDQSLPEHFRSARSLATFIEASRA